jgi:type IV pilus assembly protein PilY1
MVFFGANDGMLHAVLDVTDPDVETDGDETNHGTEAWAFIPPDQLSRLKDILEGSTHQDYVDSSPKVYFKDVDEDGLVDDGDQVILICGLRKGGASYFALDITNPTAPEYLWRISSTNDVYSPWSFPNWLRAGVSRNSGWLKQPMTIQPARRFFSSVAATVRTIRRAKR